MSQAIPLFANPGQTVSLVVQTVDGYGARQDGAVPNVMSIYFPDRSLAQGFPQPMTRLEQGLYVYDMIIPQGMLSLGTFTASVMYMQPGTNNPVWQVFTINVARPFGNSSASPI